MAAGWIAFEDAPKHRVTRARVQRFIVIVLVLGPLSVFFSRGGDSPFQELGWVALPIWFGGWSLVALVAWLTTRRVTSPFAVDLARERIRIRGRSHRFADVDTAQLDPPNNNERDGLSLQLAVRGGRKVSVLIREGREPAVLGERRDLLLAVIAGSSITRPSSAYDPTGKFARFNFPGTLDKEGAAAVVRSPPQVDEPGP